MIRKCLQFDDDFCSFDGINYPESMTIGDLDILQGEMFRVPEEE